MVWFSCLNNVISFFIEHLLTLIVGPLSEASHTQLVMFLVERTYISLRLRRWTGYSLGGVAGPGSISVETSTLLPSLNFLLKPISSQHEDGSYLCI